MWHGLSGARFEEGVVCAGCDLSRGRRGMDARFGQGLVGAGRVAGSGCGLSMVEQGVV